jgi:hypothetical protein
MKRGCSKPSAHVSTEKPSGTCRRAPAGGLTTIGRFVDEGVENGAGNCGACCAATIALPMRTSMAMTIRMWRLLVEGPDKARPAVI